MPCIEHIALLLGSHGFDDIAVTLQFTPGEIQGHFGDGSADSMEDIIKSE